MVADVALGGCQHEELHFHPARGVPRCWSRVRWAVQGLPLPLLDSRKCRCFPKAILAPALLCSAILGQVWGYSVL